VFKKGRCRIIFVIISEKYGVPMPLVKMEKECKCFQESDLVAVEEFDTIDEALERANEKCNFMNENFCGKHHFRAVFQDDNMIIKVEMNG